MPSKLILSLMLAFLYSGQSQVVAGERIYPDIERPTGTSALCVGRNSNGFAWENGDWVRTGYKPSKYVIKKVPVEKNQESNLPINLCPGKLSNNNDLEVDELFMLYRCYVVSELGQEPLFREVCMESYDDGKLNSISCTDTSNISFRPNGRFITYSSSYDLREPSETERKDSVYVEHGECSDI